MGKNMEHIDSFLQFIKDILLQNPDITLTRDIIKEWVRKRDVEADEYEINILNNGLFKEWREKYPECCKTKITEATYFLRFGNQENNLMKLNNPIKLYIPIDYNHLKDSFDKIISFLNSNNISYQAKVAKEIRIDNIVVRLSNIEDAKKIIEYVTTDEYIKEGLKSPSPFCFNYNGIALSLDSNLSYHNIVSDYIYKYISKKKEENAIESISGEDFISYIEQTYNNCFVNYSEFANMELYETNSNYSDERIILAYKQILYQMFNIHKEGFNDESFFNLFKEFNKPELVNEEKDDLCVLRCLSSIIVIQSKTMSDKDTLECIKKFIDGEPNYITNKCSLRENLILSNFIPKLKNFLTKYNTSIEELYYMLSNGKINLIGLDKKTDSEIDEIDKKIGPKLISIIEELAKLQLTELSTEGKTKAELLKEAIKDAMKKIRVALGINNPNMITRAHNLRQKLFGIRNDLLTIMFSKNIKLSSYMSSKMEYSELLQQYILENAVILTYNKYQKQYEEGNLDYTGQSFVTYSLDMLLSSGNYDGFTRDESARDNLTLLSKENVFNLITKELGKKDLKFEDITDEQRVELVSNYTSKIVTSNTRVNTK